MRNIVIIAKVLVGMRYNPFGLDGGQILFKKSLSEKLKSALKERFIQGKMDYDVTVDTTYESCETIIRNGASLLLISPYVKNMVDVTNMDSKRYYFLNEDEFNNSDVEGIIRYLKSLQSAIC